MDLLESLLLSVVHKVKVRDSVSVRCEDLGFHSGKTSGVLSVFSRGSISKFGVALHGVVAVEMVLVGVVRPGGADVGVSNVTSGTESGSSASEASKSKSLHE
jgi:hypothetical protein